MGQLYYSCTVLTRHPIIFVVNIGTIMNRTIQLPGERAPADLQFQKVLFRSMTISEVANCKLIAHAAGWRGQAMSRTV